MNTPNPPELFDGGYWYVLPIVHDYGQTPGEIPGIGWCCWYAGGLVAIRIPEPVVGLQTMDEITAAEVLTLAGFSTRPYARIGGS